MTTAENGLGDALLKNGQKMGVFGVTDRAGVTSFAVVYSVTSCSFFRSVIVGVVSRERADWCARTWHRSVSASEIVFGYKNL